MYFKFDLIVGFTIRADVRQQLENSKKKLEFWYPGSKVLITENKDWFESKFHVEGKGFPQGSEKHLKNWFYKIENISLKMN